MKLFIETEDFKNMNVGFALDEGRFTIRAGARKNYISMHIVNTDHDQPAYMQ